MQSITNRRGWFKSTLSLTAGLTLVPSLAQELMAAPVSKAEMDFLGREKKYSGNVRLNSNENPYGPSDKARQAIIQILTEANRYPFDATTALKATIAAKEGVAPECIHLGAGSGDILCQSSVAFGIEGGSIVSSYPTFPLLMNFAQVFNCRWDKVDLNDKLEHNYDAMAAAVKSDTKLVFICNPNNPTGTYVDAAKVRSFCETVSTKVPVYVDEAYIEFLEPSQQISMVELVKKNLNVIVSKTFSKIYGLAGLRIGYIVAKPDLINRVAKYAGDIPINQTAIAAANASLGDVDFMKLTREKNAAARLVLTDYLDKHKIMYGKSLINVVFFPAPKDGKMILAKMEEKGFLMRVWDYQQKEWCRVSIGTIDEMRSFVKAFDEVTA
ncbi:MAG: aminotransferase class I/II-fold pyridoxal phosphate-dependent enzyme [Cyclobacteriaceae bacterium]|nr:aminotransferase class I/II-fold pyridoxal phosphate-dependent enzyme [Cyclobacteriaceae bacterium]